MAVGVPEEILRFSVVRNPQSVPSDKLQDSVVPIVPSDVGEEHPYTFALLNMRRDNATRRAIIANAERLIAAPAFAANVKKLGRRCGSNGPSDPWEEWRNVATFHRAAFGADLPTRERAYLGMVDMDSLKIAIPPFGDYD